MHERSADVLIIGAGPAGLSAALELKRMGVENIVVIDRDHEAGGTPRLCHHTGFGLKDLKWFYTGPGYARHYVRKAQNAGIEIWTDTTATDWLDSTAVAVTGMQGRGKVQAKAVLLATGCRERPRAARLVPGSRPKGVFTTGSLQDFVHGYHEPVGKKAVIVGAELVSFSALLTMKKAGVRPVLMVTELPSHQAVGYYRPFKWFTSDLLTPVKIATNAKVSKILGYPRVAGVEVTNTETGDAETVECDTVIFSGDWIPDHELARRAGIAMDAGTLGPQVDMAFRTSQKGVFAVGNLLRGAETADDVAIEARSAARSIMSYLKKEQWPDERIAIIVEQPVQWISPNVVDDKNARAADHFLFRVSDFVSLATLKVIQGDKVVYAEKYRNLTPNLSNRLSAQWVSKIDPKGEKVKIHLNKSS